MLNEGLSEGFGLNLVAELDYGSKIVLCRGSERFELSGVAKGIPLELREDFVVIRLF